MFKTRMTQMFGIEHPVMLAGVNRITDNPTAKELINRGLREAEETLAKLNSFKA